MFIVWGTKIKRKRLGRVADFCPMCRDYRVFLLTRVVAVRHLYYLPLGAGKLRRHERTCEVCGQTLNADVKQYASTVHESANGLTELVAKTNPKLHEKYASRLDLERRIREKKLTNDERLALIREPLVLVNSLIEARGVATHVDLQSGLACLMTILLPTILFISAGFSPVAVGRVITHIALAMGSVVLLFTLYSLFTDSRRFVRRRLHPKLLKTLRPLEPTQEELTDVLSKLRLLGMPVGGKIKARKLYEEMTA